jgi:hypothetical protein
MSDTRIKTFAFGPSSRIICTPSVVVDSVRSLTMQALEKELCLAAASGDRAKMRQLLDQGVSPNARDEVRESLAPEWLAEFLFSFLFFGRTD